MNFRTLAVSILICGTAMNAPLAWADDSVINDRNGNAFMEEVGAARKDPVKREVKLPLDMSNVGVPMDEHGNIIPRVIRDAGPVIQTGGSGIQMTNEIPALTVPVGANGLPIGAPGTTFIQSGPLMRVPNPVYQQPNINLRLGGTSFTNMPFGPFAPPPAVYVPVMPNGTTTYSNPFSSGSVTNTTRVFGPSTTNPLPDTNPSP
jgi:hypothetical protein